MTLERHDSFPSLGKLDDAQPCTEWTTEQLGQYAKCQDDLCAGLGRKMAIHRFREGHALTLAFEQIGYGGWTPFLKQHGRHLAESEAVVENVSRSIEAFAERHSLWSVSPNRLMVLFDNHLRRLQTTTVTCGGCKEDVSVGVDHSAEDLQTFGVRCRKCGRRMEGQLLIDKWGEAIVLWTGQSDEEDRPKH